MSNGSSAPEFFPGLASQQIFTGIALSHVFWASNATSAAFTALVLPVIVHLNPRNSSNSSVAISASTLSFENFTSFYLAISSDRATGEEGGEKRHSSQLFNRYEVVDISVRSTQASSQPY